MTQIDIDKHQTLQLLENTNKAAKIGVFQFEVASNKIYWNEVLRSIYEVTIDFEPSFELVLDFIKEDNCKEELRKAHIDAVEFGESYELEYQIVTAKGRERYIWVKGQAIIEDGKCIYSQGAVIDITNRKKSELELEKKHQQLLLTERTVDLGYWRWDTIKNEETWSDNLYKIFEREKGGKLTFETYLEYVHHEDTSFVTKILEEAFKNKIIPKYSHRIVLKNGGIKTILLAGQVITNESGVVIEMVGTCQDITEKEAKEYELSQSNKRLELSEEINSAGSWQLNLATNEFKLSDNLYKIYELEFGKKICLKKFFKLVHPDDRAFLKTKLDQILETHDAQKFSHRILLGNNRIKTLKVISDVVTNSMGKVIELTGTSQDITNQVKTEQELQEINLLLHFAEKLTQIGFWRWKPDTDDIFWSDRLYENFEHSKKDKLVLETYYDYIHPEDKKYVQEKLELSIKKEKFHDFTHRTLLPSGKIKTFQINGVVNRKNENAPLELLGTCLDITESEFKASELSKKNQQLRIAENLAKIGYWQWNTITNEIVWSDNLYKIYEHEKSVPVSFEVYLGYIHEDDKNFVASNIEATLKDKLFRDSTYKLRLKNGKVKTIKSLGKVITDKKGKIIEMIGICQDITDNILREKELLQKNHILNRAEHLAKFGSWFFNPDTKEYKWSHNLYNIYDFEPGTAINFDHLLTRIHPDDQENVKKHYKKLFHSKIFKNIIYRIKHRNGTVRIIEAEGKATTNNLGEIVEVIGTSRDITDQEQAKQAIIESNKILEETTTELTSRNRQLAEFNHITSHNLRAPVSNLNALLDLWKSANVNLREELFDKFEIVTNHLTLTLNSLIESLKITNKQDVCQEKIAFEETLNKTKEILAAEIFKTKAIISSDFSEVETISYNQIYLESIFQNLLSNAIKYKSPNRIPKIEIKSTVSNEKINLSFRDNGLGIDLKQHGSKLFGLHKVFHKHPEASGVGLFLTKTQIEAMGGSISASSQVNVGTTFHITFN